MVEKHLSSQFDAELNAVSTRIMAMGGLVETQIANAINALITFDLEKAQRVIDEDRQVNQMEMAIDNVKAVRKTCPLPSPYEPSIVTRVVFESMCFLVFIAIEIMQQAHFA